jgi:hypothetical protein
MAPKPNKAFVKIGCGLTPLSSPNCAYYSQGELFQRASNKGERDKYFCRYFNRFTLTCTSKVAASVAMVERMKEFGIFVKADDKQIKED